MFNVVAAVRWIALLIFTLGSLAAALAGALPGAGVLLILNVNYAHLYLVGSIPALLLLVLWARHERRWLILLPFCLYGAYSHARAYYPHLFPRHDDSCAIEARGPALRIMLITQGSTPPEVSCMKTLIAEFAPDLIGFLRVPPQTLSALALSERLPFMREVSPSLQMVPEGVLALASSVPLHLERTTLGDNLPVLIRARREGPTPVIVSLLAFSPTFSEIALEQQQVSLRRLLSLVRERGASEVIFGDFAATLALKNMRLFLSAGQFRPAAAGFLFPFMMHHFWSTAGAIQHHILLREMPEVTETTPLSACGVGLGSMSVRLGRLPALLDHRRGEIAAPSG